VNPDIKSESSDTDMVAKLNKMSMSELKDMCIKMKLEPVDDKDDMVDMIMSELVITGKLPESDDDDADDDTEEDDDDDVDDKNEKKGKK
jgi:hypothetical protein